MLEATGNLWTYPADLRVITTNGFVKRSGEAVMGRGCALEATQRYPGIARHLGDNLRVHGNHVFLLAGGTPDRDLASMPVKHAWMEPADLALIIRSADELAALVTECGYQRIVLPRPGCGNGRLHWDDVRQHIAPILDDRFTAITFGERT
jgi:hypothetical protein